MLVNVNVKNLALIREADIYFDEGLNILTGETGAGKSIIIGSVLIALGGKIPKELIRDEEKEALVELVFQINDEDTVRKLGEQEIELSENQLVISRKIVNGKSTIKVNGENFTITRLKNVTELLIDIHGQHDHQSLLKKDKHLEILDEFCGNTVSDKKKSLSIEYKHYVELKKELEECEINQSERERNIDFLQFEINEIENAHIKKGEFDSIEEKFKLVNSSKNLLEKMSNVYEILNGSYAISEKLGEAVRITSSAVSDDKELNGILDSLNDMDSICQDTYREIKNYLDNMSFDEEEIIEITDRYDELNRLRQKYEKVKSSEDPAVNIENYKNEQLDKLNYYLNIEERKEKISSELVKNEKRIIDLCQEISEIRQVCARDLERKIIEVLNGLNFMQVEFEISFSRLEYFTPKGYDDVEFMISTNPGEKLNSLGKVASGGELSRIMLGKKTIMAEKDNIDTLIFDEIDTGISGRTAQMVAERMKELSKIHQVICITHLPQIAAMAAQHFVIEKNAVDFVTETSIHKLNYDESINELARMLSGSQVTENVINNAKEMKKLANN